MPHLRFRALKSQQVQELSASLPGELAPILNTSIDNFTIESVQTQFYKDGKTSEGYPLVEVLWFARGQEVQDACAKVINRRIQELCPGTDVAITFVVLPQNAYYENGAHFG
jgi:hypothetical protein